MSKEHADWLRALAQNDYMIDGVMLEDGKHLVAVADFLDPPSGLPEPKLDPDNGLEFTSEQGAIIGVIPPWRTADGTSFAENPPTIQVTTEHSSRPGSIIALNFTPGSLTNLIHILARFEREGRIPFGTVRGAL
jgi:hypothetical protein